MSDAPISTASSSMEQRLGVQLVGVYFLWHGEVQLSFDKANLEQGGATGGRLRAVVAEAMERQRRQHLEYWDVMTYLESVRLPEPLASSDEAEVATELIWMMGRGHLRDKAVLELTRLPLVAHSRARLRAYGEGLSDPLTTFTPRFGPRPNAGITHDPVVRKGIYRTIEVDMTVLGCSPKSIDWERLLVQAVLVQIHADLEMYYETRFLRVRRCERRACGAWFSARHMDGRGRFCSAACRVANARDKSAPKPAPRPRRRSPA